MLFVLSALMSSLGHFQEDTYAVIARSGRANFIHKVVCFMVVRENNNPGSNMRMEIGI